MGLYANSLSGYDKPIKFCIKQIVNKFFYKARSRELDLSKKKKIFGKALKRYVRNSRSWTLDKT